jgi:hypothetical protein
MLIAVRRLTYVQKAANPAAQVSASSTAGMDGDHGTRSDERGGGHDVTVVPPGRRPGRTIGSVIH